MKSVWFMYHDVFEDEPPRNIPRSSAMYHVSIDGFRRHVERIRRSGLQSLTASEFLCGSSKRSVCLTFDDGWAGIFDRAIPLLREAGLKATVFITRDFVGREGFCTAETIRSAAGPDIEIGVHATTHRMLSACSEEQIEWEFRACREYLEALICRPVRSASIPGGDWNATIATCARRAGLRAVCTSRPGINRPGQCPLRLNRIGIKATTTADDIGRWCRFAVSREVLRWTSFQIPRRALGMKRYSLLRRWILREQRGHADELFAP